VKNTIRILEAFATIKTLIADVEARSKEQGNKKLTADEMKIVADATRLMVDLRNEYIRVSGLPVTAICQIFELSNQRVYQIRGKQKKAA
jgi:hypothetical protein